MQQANDGDFVKVAFEAMLEDKEVFDTSNDTGPLEFIVGFGTVFPGIDAAVTGMKQGETKVIKLPAKGAYGERDEDLVQELPRQSLNAEISPQPGMIIGMLVEKDGQEQQVPASITAVTEDSVTIDYNHPLAGRDIFYKITLESINEPESASPQSD